MCECGLSCSKYLVLYSLTLPPAIWDDKMPTWRDEDCEWYRYCDMAWSYYWTSNDLSGGGSSASRPRLTAGNWNHRSKTMDKERLLYKYPKRGDLSYNGILVIIENGVTE